MKFVLQNLKVGDSLRGQVEEILPADDLLINFDGDLLRVHNETRRPLKIGDPVTVLVKAIRPIRFQLVPERTDQKRFGRIDVSV